MKIRLLVIALSVLLNGFPANADGKIKMVFRFDDYLLIPSTLSDSLLNIFQKNKIPLCIGILPFDTSGSFIYKLNQYQVNDLRSRIHRKEIEVGLHGFNHLNVLSHRFLTRTTYSEFATVDYNKQYEKLAKGKMVLDTLLQINTSVFIPTFNTYDNNTLKVLEELKFEIISGGLHGPSKSEILKYIPPTYENFSELPDIIENFGNEDVTIIIYFHSYAFKESRYAFLKDPSGLVTFSQLDTLLNWIKKQNVSFYTFSDLAVTENFDRDQFRANSYKYNLLLNTLNFVKLYRYGVYSGLEYHRQKTGLMLANIILHLVCFLLTYFFANFFIGITRASLKTVLIFLGICALPVLIYLYYIRYDFSLEVIIILLFVITCAIILSLFRKYKPSKRLTKTE